MKQWATAAWHRQRFYSRPGESDSEGSRAQTGGNNSPVGPSLTSARPQLQLRSIVPPLLPLDHISTRCGENLMDRNALPSSDASNINMSMSENPEGAALGITGQPVLDNTLNEPYHSVSFYL